MIHWGNIPYRFVLLGLIVSCGWGAMALATEANLEQPLELSALVQETLAHNPEIHAAQQRYRAALARPSQAGSLPDPMIEGGYHNERITPLTLGESDFSFLRFGASQEVPFPGKLSLREDIASWEADREDQMLQATTLSVTA